MEQACLESVCDSFLLQDQGVGAPQRLRGGLQLFVQIFDHPQELLDFGVLPCSSETPERGRTKLDFGVLEV